MTIRPIDPSGDILPVLSSADLVTGAKAVARLAEYRLNFHTGEWWENPDWGCSVIEQLRDSRLAEADARSFSSYLSAYVRETEGVQEVTDVRYSISGRRFSWSCTVWTESGSAGVAYEAE